MERSMDGSVAWSEVQRTPLPAVGQGRAIPDPALGQKAGSWGALPPRMRDSRRCIAKMKG